MLLTREEMSFDFGGAKLDPMGDREILRFMFSQFLYGEVTGIQVGHWIYAAPDLEAARFLAKQAVEELQHVGSFLQMMHLLQIAPVRAHPVLRFLATGMMGDDWAEHVALEMAIGEGFVLTAFYATIATLDHNECVTLLERAARQEEGHVDFGERRTMQLIATRPALRRRLLAASLVWMWGVTQLARHIERRLPKHNPVLQQLPAYLAHTLRCSELRLSRLGLLQRPLLELSLAFRLALMAELFVSKAAHSITGWLTRVFSFLPFVGRPPRLTESYLLDPAVQTLKSVVEQSPKSDGR